MSDPKRTLPPGPGLKTRKRQAVRISTDTLVEASPLVAESRTPLHVRPAVDGLDAIPWATAQRDWIKGKLYEHRSILFRGFDLGTPEKFEGFAGAICTDLYGDYGDLPREPTGNIYRSTVYPADQYILFHNESSHCGSWPLKQFFCCQKASPVGGNTPILDCRRVYEHLDPAIRNDFEQRGLMYVRTFLDGVDIPWQTFFNTQDRSEVEENCRANHTQWEWLKNDQLQIRQAAPAIAVHPITGDKVFFNQIQLHHVACLEPTVRESLVAMFGENRLPRNVYFGDGTTIPDETVNTLSEMYREMSVEFPWQEGDVLMVDNMLTSHSRNPYEGPRKILVALAEMFQAPNLQGSPN